MQYLASPDLNVVDYENSSDLSKAAPGTVVEEGVRKRMRTIDEGTIKVFEICCPHDP